MSVEELKLSDSLNNTLKIRRYDVGFVLTIKDMNGVKNSFLTKKQAHLLMLYLQEHLGAVQ